VAAAPLPSVWVELIHSKLALVYGQRFTQQYAGLEGDTLRKHWAQELAGITEVGIRHALSHLPPDHPPNVLQFRALCSNRPPEGYKALPAPKASPERIARAMEALRALQGPSAKHPRAWAYALRERERQGDHLTALQKQWWREALRVQLTSEEESA
jgi:hypothetical protein